jgi:hypothetical protein
MSVRFHLDLGQSLVLNREHSKLPILFCLLSENKHNLLFNVGDQTHSKDDLSPGKLQPMQNGKLHNFIVHLAKQHIFLRMKYKMGDVFGLV